MSEPKKHRGRPKTGNAMPMFPVRLDEETVTALKKYLDKYDLENMAASLRHALRKTLRDEGLLK